MEQYPIPQFIEQEGKIAFFISFRQFFYLLAAGVVCFILYFILKPFFLFAIVGSIVAITAVVLAFVTVNGMPIADIILSSFGFLLGSKNYTWKKKESDYPFKSIKRVKLQKIEEGPVLKAQESRLKKIHSQVELRTK